MRRRKVRGCPLSHHYSIYCLLLLLILRRHCRDYSGSTVQFLFEESGGATILLFWMINKRTNKIQNTHIIIFRFSMHALPTSRVEARASHRIRLARNLRNSKLYENSERHIGCLVVLRDVNANTYQKNSC